MHTHKVTSALSILGTLLAPEVSVTSLAWDNIFIGRYEPMGGEYHAVDVKRRRQQCGRHHGCHMRCVGVPVGTQ
jgi:hypothetical protein